MQIFCWKFLCLVLCSERYLVDQRKSISIGCCCFFPAYNPRPLFAEVKLDNSTHDVLRKRRPKNCEQSEETAGGLAKAAKGGVSANSLLTNIMNRRTMKDSTHNEEEQVHECEGCETFQVLEPITKSPLFPYLACTRMMYLDTYLNSVTSMVYTVTFPSSPCCSLVKIFVS